MTCRFNTIGSTASVTMLKEHFMFVLNRFTFVLFNRAVPTDMPRVVRGKKTFPTESTYEGSWNVLGMSGDGTYCFPYPGT